MNKHKNQNDKNIIIVLNSLIAEGCPQLALQLARYWQSRGIKVTLYILNNNSNEMREEFKNNGIKIYYYKLGQGLIRYINLLYYSWQLCRKIKPDAVLSFPLGWHSFIALGAKLSGTKRICAHVGNLPPIWNKKEFFKFKLLVQMGRIFTHRLICCSDYIRKATVRDFYLNISETRVIYNSCSDIFFDNKYEHKQQKDRLILGMVARLEIHKDQETFIKACSILKERGVNFESWLVGDGSKRKELEKLIYSLDLQDNLKILGTKRNIVQILSGMDLFIFTAKRDEGFGIAMAEAMALGIPVIATDVGACREVLNNGICGYLVPPKDPISLSNKIIYALNNKDETNNKIKSARIRAESNFMNTSMANLYAEELLD